MRFGLLFLVVAAVVALSGLLWWRFKGAGRTATAEPAAVATRNHHSLRVFHYGPVKAAQPPGAPGTAIGRLLDGEEAVEIAPTASSAGQQAEQTAWIEKANAELLSPAQAAAAATPQPASIRHTAGAVGSLLDALDQVPAPAPLPNEEVAEPAPEVPDDADEPIAAALFHNPLTAPAPTANDQANRAAEIALRQQRRARMAAGSAAQRAALNGLFPGATGVPAGGA
ncbi:hypothetical protein GCM10023172_01070 [Hymenobacter ginsengisoli]|uniref:Uncharacterized protein n=1 Tax=Hymenobacter ginsengisoli TaxID=1051626 RepID=A0ABP8PTU6_9BACT|nr:MULTISPECIES: hypothetical protein [unclassified Hymenobacter]MBO2033506.1 hypothetical protein [Hymenobacter sp. BT559]